MKKAAPTMPIFPGLIANRWKGAPKAHCKIYPLYTELFYKEPIWINLLEKQINKNGT